MSDGFVGPRDGSRSETTPRMAAAPTSRLLLILLLGSCSSCRGFVFFQTINAGCSDCYEAGGVRWLDSDSFQLDRITLRWSLPPQTEGQYTDKGLASGITWALHPAFCDRMLPAFPEQIFQGGSFFGLGKAFLDCDDLRYTVAQAFNTWAANHKRLYFEDVTDVCAESTVNNYCDAAEVFVVPDELNYMNSLSNATSSSASTLGLAAFVLYDTN